MSKIHFDLLKHQKTFVKSNVNTMLVGGYGSGKSHSGAIKTIIKKLQNPKYKVAYYLPTYPLIRDIAFDKFTTILEELGLQYKLNKSDKEITIDNYGTIIFRSMDNPETIVGYETAYSLIDEADILPLDKMEKVYQKILGRNRAINNATLDAVSTPEGFKWLYKQSNSGNFSVVKAKTTDNKFLPEHYINQLKEQYPEQLLKAYMEGEFVNLTSGTVYKFDRSKHHSDRTIQPREPLIIGQDFNVGGCCSVVYVKDGNSYIAVDEFVSNDTEHIIENTTLKYKGHDVTFYPDSSGRKMSTNASKSDIQMLRGGGFKVNAPKANGRVQDRVNATNRAYENGTLLINTNKCPQYAKAQEQQAYDKNGKPEKYEGAATIDDYNDAGTYPIVRLNPIIKPTMKNFSISSA